MYIPPRDSTSMHYKTAHTDIQHCIPYITKIPHSVLTGDVNAHSILWRSYTDDHRGQLITDVISNSDHITLNTNTPTRVTNTTLQQTSSPRCLTHCTTGHRGQLNTQCHHTTYTSSPQLTYDMTTDYNKDLVPKICSKDLFQRSVPKISAYSWWNCQATHNRLQIEINYYPDSLLFVSAGFLPRVSSQRLN